MYGRLPGGRRLACWITLVCLGLELCPAAGAAGPACPVCPTSRLERVLRLGPGPLTTLDDPGSRSLPGRSARPSRLALFATGDTSGPDSSSTAAGRHQRTRSATIVGAGLFASGLFLCSWGITSWQRKEDQCCPPRNSENVIKITVGIVLVDAGLVYLLGGVE